MWDYEAISYQFTPTFFTRHKRSQTSETRMHYTMCWQLVFIHIRQFVIYLALFFLSLSPIHEAQIYFIFLSVGNLKTVLKGGYSGWRGGSSFASLWTKHWLVRACKCAYDCGLTLTTIIILLLWWAFHASVTTINTTVTLFRF